jgi:hypothetical protein
MSGPSSLMRLMVACCSSYPPLRGVPPNGASEPGS